jgi:FkbM family methyltransferase
MNILRVFYNRVIRKIKPLKTVADWIIRIITPKSIKMKEGILIMNRRDPAMCGLLIFGLFEPFMTEIFRRQIRQGLVVIDIGANIGYYTIIASTLVGPHGKVIAYEPEDNNYSFLLKNIEYNKLDNVVPVRSAVSDRNGKIELHISNDNGLTHAIVANCDVKETVYVTTTTLDHSLKTMGVNKVDILKIDIEGAEIMAIKGMGETIRNNPNIIIFTEFYPKAIRRFGQDPSDFLKSFISFDLSIWVIDEGQKTLTKLNPEEFKGFVDDFPDGELVKNLYVSKSMLS